MALVGTDVFGLKRASAKSANDLTKFLSLRERGWRRDSCMAPWRAWRRGEHGGGRRLKGDTLITLRGGMTHG